MKLNIQIVFNVIYTLKPTSPFCNQRSAGSQMKPKFNYQGCNSVLPVLGCHKPLGVMTYDQDANGGKFCVTKTNILTVEAARCHIRDKAPNLKIENVNAGHMIRPIAHLRDMAIK
jgi:hypothetical protein